MSEKFKFNSKKEKGRMNIFSYGEKIFEDYMLSGCHIEMFSNREMFLEGCQGVMEYNESFLRLNLVKGVLVLFGSDFNITHFEGDTIRIKGNISSIEFCV